MVEPLRSRANVLASSAAALAAGPALRGTALELVVAQVQSLVDAAAKYGVPARGFPAHELVDAYVSFR